MASYSRLKNPLHYKIIWLLLFLPLTESFPVSKSKRGLVQFGTMMFSYVGKNPLDFSGYGNYCGYGGDGEPVDPLDHCCEIHDACYGYVQEKADCWSNTIATLVVENYKYTATNDSIECDKENSKCSQLDCICDKSLCECLKAFIHLYNARNRG